MSELFTENVRAEESLSSAVLQPEKSRQTVDRKLSTVWVVLPAFNEELGIEPLVEKIMRVAGKLNNELQILVVNDASTDQTGQIVSQPSFTHPLTAVHHEQNQGLSGALRTGLSKALEFGQPGDIIVTMDADDTQPPATIPAMVTRVEEGLDVVIASRYQPGSRTVGVPRHRLAMTLFARWLFKLITPISGVRDYTCGFRAYRFDVLREISDHYGDGFVSEKGFSCMADVLLKMRPFDPVMGEVPMILRYDQKGDGSKMRVSRTAMQTVRLLLKRRFGIMT